MRNERVMKEKWVVLPRGDVAPHWSGMYVSLNKHGSIVMSRTTYERFGEPEAVLILFDMMTGRLALRPASLHGDNAYPVRKYGRGGGKVVRAYRLLSEFNINPFDTFEFCKPKIDADGQLMLDFKDVRISPKAHSQCRKKEKDIEHLLV